MVWSEFRSLFKFKCYVRVSFEGSLSLAQCKNIDSKRHNRFIIRSTSSCRVHRGWNWIHTDLLSNPIRVMHNDGIINSFHSATKAKGCKCKHSARKCNFHLSLRPFVARQMKTHSSGDKIALFACAPQNHPPNAKSRALSGELMRSAYQFTNIS